MTELETLLHEALTNDAEPFTWTAADTQRAWSAGRRHRRVRVTTGVVAATAVAVSATLVVTRAPDRPATLNAAPSASARQPSPQPKLGQTLGEFTIPRLGAVHPVLVQGDGWTQLEHGVGHFPDTAMPGGTGNFVALGDRTTYGKPFLHLDKLRPGDHIIIDTAHERITYLVTGSRVVDPRDVAVANPNPPAIGDQHHSSRLVTLITPTPLYSAAERLIVRGRWVSTVKR